MIESYVYSKQQSWLSWFLKGLLLLGFIMLATRLFELQGIKGAYYRSLSDDNRVRRVPIIAPRGEIYARGGEKLAENLEVKKEVTSSTETGVVKQPTEGDGESTVVEWRRNYPFLSTFAHVVGYVNETNAEEVGRVDPDCLEKGVRILGSTVGRSGLEEYYNCRLRGTDGEELIEVDTFGRKLRTLGRRDSLKGDDLRTTVDVRIQRKVVEVMEDKKGALIISDPKGEILAFYSSPSYDPSNVGKYVGDEDLPLFNRAIGGIYPPGSIFKIVTSVAAIQEKAIDKDFEYVDRGVVTVGDFSYSNWYFTQYGGTEGTIDLPRAIARSTDTFFYEVGGELGVDKLAFWARKFNLEEKTGIDLPHEVPGLVPTPEWKKAVKGERWFLGNTYHLAIGQGDLLVTPIETHMIATTVANNGVWCRPHLTLGDPDCRDLNISDEALIEVREGMIGACSAGGTAFPFFDFQEKSGVSVACKTGTAEINEDDETNAWFTIYAPVANPQVVLTVLIEKGGEGSRDAAPIAREVLDYIFNP